MTWPGLLAGRSIALRLAAFSAFWSALILLIAGLILSKLYNDAAEQAFDQRLLAYANDLSADLAAPEPRELGTLGDPRFDIPMSGWYWQAGRPGGAVRDSFSSRSLLGNQLPMLAQAPDRRFGQIRKDYVEGPEHRSLRVLERDIDLGEDGRYIVRVAGPGDEVSGAVHQFVAALAVTFALLGGALGLSTLLQIRFGLEPLQQLRSAVSSVRRGNAERIAGEYPRDIAPLAQELNLLLEANREILERARTQVGNLAHALKTPLSIIGNEADHLQDGASARLREQAETMRHQIDFYLNRARAAALVGTLGILTDVEPVLDGLVRTFSKIYADKHLAVDVALAPGLRFRGESQDLEEMIGNLVDNACKWARSRVLIRGDIVLSEERSLLEMVIEEDGPGLAADIRAQMPRRGRRLDETKPGSGLGLSIVADLADLYRGSLVLEQSDLGGLRATLRLLGDRGEPSV